jgi:hypothetical protein
VLTEEKLDQIDVRFENPLDAMHRKQGFKVSGFMFAERNFII